MKLKETIVGLAAAAALTIGIAGSASAETTNATLDDNPTGTCAAAITGASIDFGTYVWDGDEYIAPGTQPSFQVNITQTEAPEAVCDVTVLGTDLTSGLNTIPVGTVVLTATGTGTATPATFALSTSAQALYDNTTGTKTVEADLTTSALTTKPTGLYSGTLTLAATLAP
jgi:hypothetical protein